MFWYTETLTLDRDTGCPAMIFRRRMPALVVAITLSL